MTDKLFSGKKRKLQTAIMKQIGENNTYKPDSVIYKKVQKGLMKMSDPELDALWTMILCMVPKKEEPKPWNQEEEMKKAVDKLASVCNSSILEPKHFGDEVMRQHPTLQQSIFRCFAEAIKRWAEIYDKGWFDLRNEDTAKISKDIMERIGDKIFYLRNV